MSQWTHVEGCIRVDCLRVIPTVGMTHRKQLEEILGADLPTGSEGPLEVVIHENPMPSHVAAFAVMVFGDLRDFGPDDVPKIETWMEGVARGLSAHRKPFPVDFPGYIRNAVIEVEVEYHEPRVWRYDNCEDRPLEDGKWVELPMPPEDAGENERSPAQNQGERGERAT